MSAHHQAGQFHGKRSLFQVNAEDATARVLETPAPGPFVPTFGQSWEHLTMEIERHITARDVARQAAEDERAVRRNRNRMLTLLGAFLLSCIVTYALQKNILHLAPATAKVWAPYAFAITIALDSGLAIYSWIRRY